MFPKQAANSLVTETSQYFVVFCRYVCSAILAKCLIINDLRLILVILFFIAFLNITYVGRHTYATLSLALGTDIITIKNVLGHKQESTTMRYTKVVNPLKEQAAKRLSINTISQNTEQYEKGNF